MGDLVWIYLRKDRFLQGKFWKLKPKADGPFKVLKRISKNAYEIELPEGYGVSPTFMWPILAHIMVIVQLKT